MSTSKKELTQSITFNEYQLLVMAYLRLAALAVIFLLATTVKKTGAARIPCGESCLQDKGKASSFFSTWLNIIIHHYLPLLLLRKGISFSLAC
ncbi:hypothetical protein RJT34_30223 [Clitoria ternatea]|uniref:Uncharacterized protein n=1 Tax=Clitoria ternatea TaxID=43366 RepID=A0AAN9ESX2_CLITE